MKAQRFVDEGGQAALALLRLISASADTFPPLKGVAGGALHIIETVANFRSNQSAWAAFGEYVRDALGCVIGSLPDASEPRKDLKRNMERLQDTLEHIDRDIQAMQANSAWRRALEFTGQPDKITAMRAELNDALNLFQLGSALTTSLDVSKVLEGVDIQQLLRRVTMKLNHKIEYLVLNTLPYAKGASWDPDHVCLDSTRVALLKDISEWITSNTQTAEVFWLTDVAGSGKSAVAHTVAQHSYNRGLLVSSFFFARGEDERDKPKMLFSTIARDLATLNVDVAERISMAIEDDRSLPTAPISRQFEKLVLGPIARYSGQNPIVIVIDALDEACDISLLRIFRDDIRKLPRVFRIFLTSRPEREIDYNLSTLSHIRRRTLNIHEEDNRHDVASYIQFRLRNIAERKRLGPDWPGRELSRKLIGKADGLFIWASTISDYLCLSNNPGNQLKWLLEDHIQPGIHAEAKMDKLYMDILNTCNWSDNDFMEGYNLIMGVIVAAKTPLSLSALQAFHPTLQVFDTLGQLGSLLSGWTEEHQTIRVHLSFRDFLTIHSSSLPDCRKFHVSETVHSQRLALLCLVTLDHELRRNIPGTGYLIGDASHISGVPEIAEDHISEGLWYSCRFWMDHVLIVNTLKTDLVNALQKFLSTRLIRWIEILTSKGRFLKMDEIRKWVVRNVPEGHDLVESAFNVDVASALHSLSSRLSYLGRREEALQAIEEAAVLRQQLATKHPATFNPDLSDSLNDLSLRLSDLGRREEALQTVKEALTLRRQLAIEHRRAFVPELADTLSHLSLRLSDLGRRQEALQAIKEAVELHQQLEADNPDTFKPNLAMSFHNLSHCLSDLGYREEALHAVKEAVALRRQLVNNDPATFNPDLAASLNNLALCLSHLGHKEQALQTVQEGVLMYRQLAAKFPAAFKPSLAKSLNNLSLRQFALGHQRKALETSEEALVLNRQLVMEHPTAFNPDLAMSLHNLSVFLLNSSRNEQALQAIQEAVSLRRQLAAKFPAAFNPDLAVSLHCLSFCLSDLGQLEEGIEKIREVVTMYRQLAIELPGLFKSKLANSLEDLASSLSDLGSHEQARRVTTEVIELRQNAAMAIESTAA